MQIKIPELSIVALVGASSSGKTTFAKKHFLPTEILSSDFFRGMVSDDENDQTVSADAFELLFYAAEKCLKNGKTVVIDATNLKREDRKKIIELSRRQNVHAVAIALNMPDSLLCARNESRPDRTLAGSAIRRHSNRMKQSLIDMKREGFRYIYTIDSEEDANSVEIERTKLWNNKKDEHGPLDIIGDIHGCYDELCMLLEKLGYESQGGVYTHPDGRKAAFLGDLCDRGSKNVETLRLVMSMVRSGNAYAVPGNHDAKLARYLKGNNVQIRNGLEKTVAELEAESPAFREEVREFLDGLVSHYVFDRGDLVISHAGIRQEYIGRASMRVKSFCLYGDTTGETDDDGLPVRLDWAEEYRGRALIVYGHSPHSEVQAANNTFNIDTGCVFGGKLTAFRYPEREIVSVDALEMYAEPPRPLDSEADGDGDMLSIRNLSGKMSVETRLMPLITIPENNAAAALEIMSRFAADPHWLIYLPPTMSPCETSAEDDYLESPPEAFAYFRKNGVKNVICEKKHMGSRAVIVLCHTAETARERFGAPFGRGIIYTRTGRHFFDDPATEDALLGRLDDALTASGFWEDFNTDWVCLDTELLPWSEKAQKLLRDQYAPVGRAGRDGLASAVSILEKAVATAGTQAEPTDASGGKTLDLAAVLETFRQKRDALEKYTDAYREYCWTVESIDDFRIAPFHLLAVEGRVFSEETHVWHMETLKKYCTGSDKIFIATDYILVDTENEDSVRRGTQWWENLTGSGGEGMVVKPERFTARHENDLVQPAIKCRGREYLRIIYGPEYLVPENMKRLKKRSLARKRALALGEFSLGIEALNRFVEKAPLRKVHECVFGVLAFESEPVDPRL